MSYRPLETAPWPAQTPLPEASSSYSGKRKRSSVERRSRPSRLPRQTIADQASIDEAKADCQNADNAVISCWPDDSTRLTQNEFTQFVWNSQQPSFAQFNLVDIALIRADNGHTVVSYPNQTNPTGRAGALPVRVDDPWWEENGANWNGTATPFPFYFVIVPSGRNVLEGAPQATFTATQTTFANSVLSAMSTSSAAAASSSSEASLSSASAAASSSIASGGGASGLQNNDGDPSFPQWAIAVITVLGFFALVSFIALIILVLRRTRNRNGGSPSRRGSMASVSPMMANVQADGVASPRIEATGLASAGTTGMVAGGAAHHPASIVSPDGASTHSDSPFSGADAAVMAEAFRKALRKPDFADRPVEEGESPGTAAEPPQEELISRELAEEGRDIRSVSSSRGVRVETMSDVGDVGTTRDSHH